MNDLTEPASSQADRPTLPEVAGDLLVEDPPLDEAPLLIEDLLVEEVSIDGMCGVY